MRLTLAFALLPATWASCATFDPGAEFSAAATASPAGTGFALAMRDGQITKYLAETPVEAIPAAALRTSNEMVQPGGELTFAGQEWRDSVRGYRIVKTYGKGDQQTRRSVLVDAMGNVLERTHELPFDESPPAAQSTITALAPETIVRTEVIGGAQGTPDLYRFSYLDKAGALFYVLCSESGLVLDRARQIQSTILVSDQN